MPWMTRDGHNIYVNERDVDLKVKQGWAVGRSEEVIALTASMIERAYGGGGVPGAMTLEQYGANLRENFLDTVVEPRRAEIQAALDAEAARIAEQETAMKEADMTARERYIAQTQQSLLLAGAAASVAKSLAARAASIKAQAGGADANVDEAIRAVSALGPSRLGNPDNAPIINMLFDDITQSGPYQAPGPVDRDFLADALAALAGALGGRGSSAPVYRPPDRRMVEDMVKDKMSLLVGKKNDGTVQRLTDEYMKDHRLNWEGKTDRDPGQTVVEGIRKLSEYQTIHKLRPDTVDETEWLASQVAGVRALGVSPADEADRAIVQATAGVSSGRAAEAASIFQQTKQLKTTPLFFSKLEQSATSLARMVR